VTEPLHSVTASPLEPLRRLFGDSLDDLTGSVVSGEIPLTAGLVNRFIASKLTRPDLPIVSAEVVIHDHEVCTVHVRPRVPIPSVRIDVRIDQQPELPGRPVLGMRWSLRGLGPLGLLAGPVMGYLKALPPGIRIEGDRAWVNIEEVLRQRGLGDIVPLLTRARVTTREGRFMVAFEFKR
jgi:hypothetical protein